MTTPGQTHSERRPLKVAFLTSHPARVGSGSERLMYDTAKALFARGYDTRVYVMNSHLGGERPFFEKQIPTFPLEQRIEHVFRYVTGGNDLLFPSTFLLRCLPWLGSADIWHFHNLHGHFVSLPILGFLTRTKNVVISPVDQYLTTGHCPYPIDCEQYLDGCGSCPRPKEPWPGIRRDSTRFLWQVKRKFLRISRAHMFFHTEALADHYRRAVKDISGPVMRYGVDLYCYRPMPKAECACRFSLRESPRFTVGILHSYILEPRKGILPIIEKLGALAKKYPDTLELLVVGRNSEEVKNIVPPELSVTTLPFLKDAHDLAQALNLCDALLYPTQAENLSLTCLYALACGVPVISYDVGGQKEAIADGKNGFLIKPNDHDGMMSAILKLAGDPGLAKTMSANARDTAEKYFDFEHYIDLLTEYYRSIMDKK